MPNHQKARDIVEALNTLAEQKSAVSVRDVVEALGHRGFGALIFLPAVVGCTPLGGIPGLPSVLALIIALMAGQVALGRAHFWVPGPLARQRLSGKRVHKAACALRPVADRLDRWFGTRLDRLVSPPVPRLAATMVLALSFCVPPVELVPFAAFIPFVAIAATGLALSVRDGALMLVALAGGAVALFAVLQMLI